MDSHCWKQLPLDQYLIGKVYVIHIMTSIHYSVTLLGVVGRVERVVGRVERVVDRVESGG